MNEGNRTEISTMGEFGLIRRLTEDIKPEKAETKYGVGDEAAGLRVPNQQVLVNTDLHVEV